MTDREYAWHGKSRFSPLVSMTNEHAAVVSQEDGVVTGRPLKDARVVSSRQPRVLCRQDLDFRPATQNTADDIVVEVLVRVLPPKWEGGSPQGQPAAVGAADRVR